MDFTNPKMRQRFELQFNLTQGRCCEEREVRALVAVHASYYDFEGPNCAEIHEVVWHLLLPKLRTELRHWIRNSSSGISAAGLTLRDDLGRFLGEH